MNHLHMSFTPEAVTDRSSLPNGCGLCRSHLQRFLNYLGNSKTGSPISDYPFALWLEPGARRLFVVQSYSFVSLFIAFEFLTGRHIDVGHAFAAGTV